MHKAIGSYFLCFSQQSCSTLWTGCCLAFVADPRRHNLYSLNPGHFVLFHSCPIGSIPAQQPDRTFRNFRVSRPEFYVVSTYFKALKWWNVRSVWGSRKSLRAAANIGKGGYASVSMLEASCFSDSNTKKKRALLISEYIPISPFRELYLFPSLSTTGIYLLHLGRRIVLSFDFIDEDVEGQTNNVVNATRTFQLEKRTRHSLCWPLDLEPAQGG